MCGVGSRSGIRTAPHGEASCAAGNLLNRALRPHIHAACCDPGLEPITRGRGLWRADAEQGGLCGELYWWSECMVSSADSAESARAAALAQLSGSCACAIRVSGGSSCHCIVDFSVTVVCVGAYTCVVFKGFLEPRAAARCVGVSIGESAF